MALINDPNMYTGGAVVVDSRPHVQLYGQLLAKKKAEQDAFDEYIRNLNKSVNSAGLRNVDRQVFDKKVGDWQKYTMDNRDAIRKRSGGADIKFQQDYQDILNLVAESKGEEEKKKPLTELILDPTKRELLDENSIEGIAAHDAPLYVQGEDGSLQRNPKRKSFDYNSISFNPKPWGGDKYFKGMEDIKRMELPPVVAKDPKNMTQTVTTTSVFDDQAKDAIATRAVSEYMNDRSFKKMIDNLNVADYNPIFKANYGHDIQTPADLAAAYTLKGMQQKVVTSKIEDDTYARQRQMQAIRQADAKELINLRQSLKKDDDKLQDVWIDSYIDKLEEEAKASPNVSIYIDKGQRLGENTIPVDPVLAKAFEKTRLKNKLTPSKITITADGKYRPVYYKYDDEGKAIKDKNGEYEVDKELSVPITRNQFKLTLGAKSVTPSQRTKEMLNGNEEDEDDDPLGLFK